MKLHFDKLKSKFSKWGKCFGHRPRIKSLMRQLNITKSRLLKFPNKTESSVMKDMGLRKTIFKHLKDSFLQTQRHLTNILTCT